MLEFHICNGHIIYLYPLADILYHFMFLLLTNKRMMVMIGLIFRLLLKLSVLI
jgi:hypothetical protein